MRNISNARKSGELDPQRARAVAWFLVACRLLVVGVLTSQAIGEGRLRGLPLVTYFWLGLTVYCGARFLFFAIRGRPPRGLWPWRRKREG